MFYVFESANEKKEEEEEEGEKKVEMFLLKVWAWSGPYLGLL